MKFRPLVSVLVPALLLSSAVSADEGWSLSKLNPFASRTTSSSKSSSRGGFMSRLPFQRTATPTRRTEPTAWQKMNRGARNLLTKTKETLNPWATDKTASRASSNSSQKGWGLFSWNSQPEEPEIQTVNDWLKLPRPKY